MRFFIMKQDIHLPYCIRFEDFSITKNSHIFTKADADQLNDDMMLFLSGKGDEAAPDFIEHPTHMLADKYKDIFDAYEDDLIFNHVMICHTEAERQMQYHQILMDELEVVSDKSEYFPDGLFKKMVLDSEKIGDHHVFMVKDSRIKHPVVSLSVVESLLRRGAHGILFEEVEVR